MLYKTDPTKSGNSDSKPKVELKKDPLKFQKIKNIYTWSLESPLSQNAPYKGQIKGKKSIRKEQIWGKYEAKKGQMKNNYLVKMVVLIY